MPKSAPANVAVSPKPMSRELCISPCGSMNTPQNRSTSPPIAMTAAMMSCNVAFMREVVWGQQFFPFWGSTIYLFRSTIINHYQQFVAPLVAIAAIVIANIVSNVIEDN